MANKKLIVVKDAQASDQFGHAFTLKTRRLHNRFTGLTFPVVSGDNAAFVEAYKLEGLCLFAMRAAPAITLPGGPMSTVKIGRSRLDANTLQRVLRKLDSEGLIDLAVGLDFQALCDHMKDAGTLLAWRIDAIAMRLQEADLEGLQDLPSDVAQLRGGYTYDNILKMGYHTPYFFPGCVTSMVLTGEFILMLGPRERYSDREAQEGSYQELLYAFWCYVEHVGHQANSPEAGAKFVNFVLTRTEPPDLLSLMPASPDEGINIWRNRATYAGSSAVQREDEVSRLLPQFIFRLKHVAKACKLLGNPNTWYPKLKLIASSLELSRLGTGDALVMLQGVEDELKLRNEHIDWCIAEGTAETDFIKSLTTEASKVRHDTSSKEEEADSSTLGVRSTDLVISKLDLAAVLNSGHFLTAASTVKRLCNATRTAALLDEETRINQIFESISGPGLLIAWQYLLRHRRLRNCHEMLNQLSTVRGSLCRRIGYCQVVGGDKKRKGFSQTYVWSSELHSLYVSGQASAVSWYTKGYLVALMHIQKADEVDSSLEDMDFMIDGDHFLGMKDFMHRTLLGYGHSPTPDTGMSVGAFFDLLGELRNTALQAPLSQKPDLLELLISLFRGALQEHDVYLLDQLDEVAPVSRRLEGFLPPSSESGGIVHQLREALSGQVEIDTFRRKAPHLFKDTHRVVGRFVTGSPMKRIKTEEEADAEEGKAKGKGVEKKEKAIGALKHKVVWLDTENRYYAITKSVMGDLKELAAEVGVDFDKRCWPVMCSMKAENDRCELCPCPDLHKSRKTGMHKPVTLPKGWQKNYVHRREGFQLPAGVTARP